MMWQRVCTVVLGDTTFLILIAIPSIFVLVLTYADTDTNTSQPLLKSILSTWYVLQIFATATYLH